ncbi:SSI family serine proteinase inhibitor [Desertihabitans brevis]|uniref:SSI family serine proteinase inhibitor n=1 Tax=Desertihabitans brevis TaxID=2268447 RepID=UPI001314B533|nr:SSI family serine proteinase inhibitor [Desertihabitans brevis]
MRIHPWRIGLLVLLVVAACVPGAPGPAPQATPSAQASDSPKPSPPPPTVEPTPTPGGGADELVVQVDDGSGQVTTWTLRCDPPGGDHPDPEAACAALEQHADALQPVPADRQCTMQYGGPQTATVTGSWRGQPVSSRFALTDGCEIARWTALTGLLPPAGS